MDKHYFLCQVGSKMVQRLSDLSEQGTEPPGPPCCHFWVLRFPSWDLQLFWRNVDVEVTAYKCKLQLWNQKLSVTPERKENLKGFKLCWMRPVTLGGRLFYCDVQALLFSRFPSWELGLGPPARNLSAWGHSPWSTLSKALSEVAPSQLPGSIPGLQVWPHAVHRRTLPSRDSPRIPCILSLHFRCSHALCL